MKIQYQDEYDETVYTAYNQNVVPRLDDSVIFANEDYRVSDVIWHIDGDMVVVVITQNSVKPQKEDRESGRLAETKNAIVTLTKQIAAQQKKSRLLSEEIITIRTYLKSQKAQK